MSAHIVQAQTVEAANALEQQVKAAYLYKFCSYVEWPPNAFVAPDSPIKIGVLGSDALADELSQMVVGRTVNGRTVSVRKLHREDAISGINVLFVGRASNGRLAEILAATKGQPMLTVTEADGALTTGSIINFVLIDGKVRFEVAPKTALTAYLNISARLLAAAYKVSAGSS
ncbi:YfiR family protein [Undibacterium sp.]|uniref:YfiR family protein n=1 Tax=Undibacterium sp. TaxID=1914977 RepID=UPI002BE6E881|nr:YfiR family protein [Undibacterium sp.]HTD02642.1 YfiR family protein [Undibacterium sp.]